MVLFKVCHGCYGSLILFLGMLYSTDYFPYHGAVRDQLHSMMSLTVPMIIEWLK